MASSICKILVNWVLAKYLKVNCRFLVRLCYGSSKFQETYRWVSRRFKTFKRNLRGFLGGLGSGSRRMQDALKEIPEMFWDVSSRLSKGVQSVLKDFRWFQKVQQAFMKFPETPWYPLKCTSLPLKHPKTFLKPSGMPVKHPDTPWNAHKSPGTLLKHSESSWNAPEIS